MTDESTLASPALSAEEIEFAQSYLAQTRNEFLQALNGLTEAQWKFKSDPGCWSLEQIAEHHVLTERAIQGVVARIGDAPAAEPGWDPAATDEMIPRRVPDRTGKGQSPGFLLPTGRWTGEDLLREFVTTRQQTIELLSHSPLRGHVIPHPFFGPWDGYQWLLAAGAHGARHAGQIAEVKSHPNFPH